MHEMFEKSLIGNRFPACNLLIRGGLVDDVGTSVPDSRTPSLSLGVLVKLILSLTYAIILADFLQICLDGLGGLAGLGGMGCLGGLGCLNGLVSSGRRWHWWLWWPWKQGSCM